MSTSYTGPSVVDYLSSSGQASDYNSRAALAAKYGITGYSGTADQNTSLLNFLRSGSGSSAPAPQPAASNPAPAVTSGSYQSNGGANPVNTPLSAPPQIDTASISNLIKSGQIDPNQIDSYINGLVTNAYTRTNDQGVSTDTASASARANEIRQLLQGTSFSYGGQTYQYTLGGPVKTSTTTYNSTTNGSGTTGQTGAIGGAPATPGAPQNGAVPQPAPATPGAPTAAPAVDATGSPALPVNNAAGGTAGGSGASMGYTGASIVDYLNSTGQASDFGSRSKLAATLGISGYTGTAAQNTQMLNTLRSRSGGGNSTTAMAGTAAGASNTAGGSSDVADTTSQGIIASATNIAKSFGWVAPDPKNSPLNLVTNLFQQGLESFGINDIKTKLNETIQQQTDLENKKAGEVSEVNANPWLTEGERAKRIENISDKYKTELDTLVHAQQLYDSEYKTGLDQVQWQVGQTVSAYDKEQTANEAIFKEALDIAQKQVDAKNALTKSETAADMKTVKVGKQTYQYNSETGSYDIPVGGSGGSGSGSTDKPQFTITQLNKGASNAGTPIEQFKTFDSETQNFFVNQSTAVNSIKNMLQSVSDGTPVKLPDGTTKVLTSDDLRSAISGSTLLPSGAKKYFLSKLPASKASTPDSSGTSSFGNPFSGNFFNNIGDGVKQLLGF